ncbi:hypothetical protein GAS19_10280 [Burkholderia glumae]|uniref:hypothetical protein n=1 Tax=Burkholderia glumae TaxID=337 RepID=UPI0012979E9F|nr:hypothetical protein [Burkholderia glumae]QGA37976.1 hypothetical protein GAS19_10280 [Burkholderia glumae]
MYMLLVFVGAVLLYGAWGALVLMGKADATGYVAALAAGLTFLGKHVSQGRGVGDSGASSPGAPPTSDAVDIKPSPGISVAVAVPQTGASDQASASAPTGRPPVPTLQ